MIKIEEILIWGGQYYLRGDEDGRAMKGFYPPLGGKGKKCSEAG